MSSDHGAHTATSVTAAGQAEGAALAQAATAVHGVTTPPPTGAQDASLGDLVSRLSQQTSRLVRDELRLAQAELTAKGKKAGIGAGLVGTAGVIAFFGAACLIAAAVLALAGPLRPWAAALLVGVGLLVIAGAAALMGKKEVTAAAPPVPEEAVAGVQQDLALMKHAVPGHGPAAGSRS